MNCQQIQEALGAYVDDDLAAEKRAVVDTHLQSCASCLREKELLIASWEALEAWQPIEPSYQLKARVWEQIRATPRTGLWERLGGLRRGLLLMATAAVVALGAVSLSHPRPEAPAQVAVVAPPSPSQTPAVPLVDDDLAEELAVSLDLSPEVEIPVPSEKEEENALPIGHPSRDWMGGVLEDG